MTDQAPASSTHRWRALTVCLAAAFMTLLDVSIVNVALPSIQKGLHSSAEGVQWVLSGYALAFGIALIPAGRLGDAKGRRLVFCLGLAGFTLASAACGLAPSVGVLAVARVVQGASAGFVVPQNAGVIQQLFQGRQRGTAFGLLGTTVGLSTAIGPLAGGAIIAVAGEEQGWRWIFIVNVPIGIAVLAFAWRLLPGRPEQSAGEHLDPVGVVLLGSSLVLLLLPLVQLRSWNAGLCTALVAAALITFGCFLRWEHRYATKGRSPMVDLSLFRHSSYAFGAGLGSVYFIGFTAIFFIYSVFLQQGEHLTPLQAGLAQTPFAVGSMVSSGPGGRFVERAGRRLVVVGLVLVAVGLLALDVVVARTTGHAVGLAGAVPLLVAGIGSGLVIAPNQALSLSQVPPATSGSAAGVLQTGQRVGAAIGLAAVGSVFFGALSSSGGAWSRALEDGLRVCTAFVLLALVVGAADLVLASRRRAAAAG